MPYLPTLVENLHSYIDTVVEYVINIGITSEMPASLRTILTYSYSKEKALMDTLEKAKLSCCLDNYEEFLLS